MQGFSKQELKDVLAGNYLNDFADDFVINNFEIDPIHFHASNKRGNGFISISNMRWNHANHKQTTWISGNEKIIHCYETCEVIITEEPIESLRNIVMQLIVEDSFAVIKKLAIAARKKMTHPVIGITGSVGKSSTRLMLEHLLSEKTIVATRGNHNTQVGVPLYGAKLCSNPDVGIVEISLNALNNRGNQAKVIQPDIAIVTSIGEAHLSTLHTKENIAKFKARIFDGLKRGGLAIINRDIEEFEILYNKAKERTDYIKTYSFNNQQGDLFLKKMTHRKYCTEIEFHYNNKDYCFELKMPSNGMIQNSLCALLCVAEMGLELNNLLEKMTEFKSFDRVMELKQLQTLDQRSVDILDDTHNAAIPSMINAMETFKVKAPFYEGTKILVLGQVQDLGEQSQQLHDALLPKLLSSGADYVFGHGRLMRKVIKNLPTDMVGGWFDNAKDLARRIPMYCSDQSFVLLKGSVSGSDFRKTSYYLPGQIAISKRKLTNFEPSSIADILQPSWGAVGFDLIKRNVLFTKGIPSSTAIEGLGPIVLILLLFKKGIPIYDLFELKKWPTNRGVSIGKKPFQTGTVFSSLELINELIETQHPSATYELAHNYFGTRNAALEEITRVGKEIGLSSSSLYNLTGRYRVKEQQSYTLDDLVKLGSSFYEDKRFIKQLPLQKIGPNELHILVFGHERKAAICFYQKLLVCFNGLTSRNQLNQLLTSFHLEKMLINDKK